MSIAVPTIITSTMSSLLERSFKVLEHLAAHPQGCAVTIAGPLVRLTEQRMQDLGEALLRTRDEIAAASSASALFRRHGS